VQLRSSALYIGRFFHLALISRGVATFNHRHSRVKYADEAGRLAGGRRRQTHGRACQLPGECTCRARVGRDESHSDCQEWTSQRVSRLVDRRPGHNARPGPTSSPATRPRHKPATRRGSPANRPGLPAACTYSTGLPRTILPVNQSRD